MVGPTNLGGLGSADEAATAAERPTSKNTENRLAAEANMRPE